MIVFVAVSERRFLVLDVDEHPSGYTGADHRMGMGYVTAQAKKVTEKPVSYNEARRAASLYADERGKLISPETWHARRYRE